MLALAVAAKQPAEASPLPGARRVRSVFLVEPTGTFANDVQAYHKLLCWSSTWIMSSLLLSRASRRAHGCAKARSGKEAVVVSELGKVCINNTSSIRNALHSSFSALFHLRASSTVIHQHLDRARKDWKASLSASGHDAPTPQQRRHRQPSLHLSLSRAEQRPRSVRAPF